MRKLQIMVLFLICSLQFAVCNYVYCQQSDPDVYFNSAIDKYVKGDYDGAIALFEQTLLEKSDHQKAKIFFIKVLINASEKQILMSNFPKAKIYIDKAKIIAPDNEKVNELQKIISGGYVKKEEQKQKIVVAPQPKSSPVRKIQTEKSVEEMPVVVSEPDIVSKSEDKNGWNFILFSALPVIIIFILVFLGIKKKNIENAKRMEELKKRICLEEEKKYKKEFEKIKLEKEKLEKEIAEKLKIDIAEKKTITKKNADDARQKFDSSVEEERILQNIRNEDYSREIIQKMTISIKTIMNVNKDDALNNIKRLSESENARLRYDCVKIIENILTSETLEILIKMLDDSDYEVKKAVITLANDIFKSPLPKVPPDVLARIKKRLTEEKLKNGWII